MKTKRLSWVAALSVLGLFGLTAGHLDAQTMLTGTFTGGSNFATTMSVGLSFDAATGQIQLNITNQGGSEVFAEIGLVNIPSAYTVWGVSAPANWQFGVQSMHDDGLPSGTQAYRAVPPPPKYGLDAGASASFVFGIDVYDFASVQNIGAGVHAISGPGGCSTKFGVWNGGADNNDGGTSGGYDPSCGTTVVPEPGSMALLATGLAGLSFVARRRREEEDEEV